MLFSPGNIVRHCLIQQHRQEWLNAKTRMHNYIETRQNVVDYRESSSFSSYSHFTLGRCSMIVHFISRQSLRLDIISSLCPTTFLSSFFLVGPTFIFITLLLTYRNDPLFSSYAHIIALQLHFQDFLCEFPYFRCPRILSLLILSSHHNSAHPS